MIYELHNIYAKEGDVRSVLLGLLDVDQSMLKVNDRQGRLGNVREHGECIHNKMCVRMSVRL